MNNDTARPATIHYLDYNFHMDEADLLCISFEVCLDHPDAVKVSEWFAVPGYGDGTTVMTRADARAHWKGLLENDIFSRRIVRPARPAPPTETALRELVAHIQGEDIAPALSPEETIQVRTIAKAFQFSPLTDHQRRACGLMLTEIARAHTA